MTTIELPWPPKELFPNQANRFNGHYGYMKKARAMRTLAWGETVMEIGQANLRKFEAEGEIVLKTELQPPMCRGKVADEDGVMAALKSARDGIASALGVDDSRFRNERPVWLEREGAGKVIISF